MSAASQDEYVVKAITNVFGENDNEEKAVFNFHKWQWEVLPSENKRNLKCVKRKLWKLEQEYRARKETRRISQTIKKSLKEHNWNLAVLQQEQQKFKQQQQEKQRQLQKDMQNALDYFAEMKIGVEDQAKAQEAELSTTNSPTGPMSEGQLPRETWDVKWNKTVEQFFNFVQEQRSIEEGLQEDLELEGNAVYKSLNNENIARQVLFNDAACIVQQMNKMEEERRLKEAEINKQMDHHSNEKDRLWAELPNMEDKQFESWLLYAENAMEVYRKEIVKLQKRINA